MPCRGNSAINSYTCYKIAVTFRITYFNASQQSQVFVGEMYDAPTGSTTKVGTASGLITNTGPQPDSSIVYSYDGIAFAFGDDNIIYANLLDNNKVGDAARARECELISEAPADQLAAVAADRWPYSRTSASTTEPSWAAQASLKARQVGASATCMLLCDSASTPTLQRCRCSATHRCALPPSSGSYQRLAANGVVTSTYRIFVPSLPYLD